MFYRNNFEPKELHSDYGDAMDNQSAREPWSTSAHGQTLHMDR